MYVYIKLKFNIKSVLSKWKPMLNVALLKSVNIYRKNKAKCFRDRYNLLNGLYLLSVLACKQKKKNEIVIHKRYFSIN